MWLSRTRQAWKIRTRTRQAVEMRPWPTLEFRTRTRVWMGLRTRLVRTCGLTRGRQLRRRVRRRYTPCRRPRRLVRVWKWLRMVRAWPTLRIRLGPRTPLVLWVRARKPQNIRSRRKYHHDHANGPSSDDEGVGDHARDQPYATYLGDPNAYAKNPANPYGGACGTFDRVVGHLRGKSRRHHP